MSQHKPTVDLGYPTPVYGRIPSFANIEEEAEFWDTHDTADFTDEFVPVEVTIGPGLTKRLTVRLDQADRDALVRLAQGEGVGPETLVQTWVEERLRQEMNTEEQSQ